MWATVAIYERDALVAAERADRGISAGHRVGPLHGVPIALKDQFMAELVADGRAHTVDIAPLDIERIERGHTPVEVMMFV